MDQTANNYYRELAQRIYAGALLPQDKEQSMKKEERTDQWYASIPSRMFDNEIKSRAEVHELITAYKKRGEEIESLQKRLDNSIEAHARDLRELGQVKDALRHEMESHERTRAELARAAKHTGWWAPPAPASYEVKYVYAEPTKTRTICGLSYAENIQGFRAALRAVLNLPINYTHQSVWCNWAQNWMVRLRPIDCWRVEHIMRDYALERPEVGRLAFLASALYAQGTKPSSIGASGLGDFYHAIVDSNPNLNAMTNLELLNWALDSKEKC